MIKPNYSEDAPPEQIEINGIKYNVNTDYRVWINIMELRDNLISDANSENDMIRNYETMCKMEMLAFGGIIPYDMSFVIGKMIEFSNGYPSTPLNGQPLTNENVFDFYYDINEVIVAIRTQYGIDLSYKCKHFHWWEFLILFNGLCGEHVVLDLIKKRGYTGKDKDLLNIKYRYMLPDRKSGDSEKLAKEMDDIFYNT